MLMFENEDNPWRKTAAILNGICRERCFVVFLSWLHMLVYRRVPGALFEGNKIGSVLKGVNSPFLGGLIGTRRCW